MCRNEYIRLLETQKYWGFYSKLDRASVFFAAPIHLLVNWKGNGEEIKAFHVGNGHSASKYVMSESLYFLPGISYMLRSSRLVPYVVPRGVIPAAGRSQIYPKNGHENELLTIISSNIATAIARFRGENFGGPKFQNSMVAAIPYGDLNKIDVDSIFNQIKQKSDLFLKQYENDETSIQFTGKVSVGRA